MEKDMFAKIEITGYIEVCTGMHIGGGSTQFAAIGAIDSPIIRDTYSNLPIIPGSSLKGKMRTLLARCYNPHDRRVVNPDGDDIRILRLFGGAENKKTSRVLFSDMMLCNNEELKELGIHSASEVKFENTINRLTAVANPRQIERAVRGSRYKLQIVYDAECSEEIKEDFQMLAEGMKLLQYDYLGGSGSRGYGKVKFDDLDISVVIGNIPEEIEESCRAALKEV